MPAWAGHWSAIRTAELGLATTHWYTSPFSILPETSDSLPADSAGDHRDASWQCWHAPATPALWQCPRCARGHWSLRWRARNARRSRAHRWRIGISKGISAGTSRARSPEHRSATHLRTCLPWGVHARTQCGAAAPCGATPEPPGGSGAALLVLRLETRFCCRSETSIPSRVVIVSSLHGVWGQHRAAPVVVTCLDTSRPRSGGSRVLESVRTENPVKP